MNTYILVDAREITFSFIRSPGPGGQNVNKVASAVLLRFNVKHSPSLSESLRQRLLSLLEKNLTRSGDLLIKATRYRSQERNKQDALDRLQTLLNRASIIPKKRRKTKPTLASKERRLSTKKLHAKNKSLRGRKVHHED